MALMPPSVSLPIHRLSPLTFHQSVMPHEAAPVPTLPYIQAFPIDVNGWHSSLDSMPKMPTIPLACTALLALVCALIVCAAFMALGWYRARSAIARFDEEQQCVQEHEHEIERRSVVVSVVSDTEIFS